VTPRYRLLACFAVSGATLAFGASYPGTGSLGLLLNGAIVVAAVVDLARSFRPGRLAVKRTVSSTLHIGSDHRVHLSVSAPLGERLTIDLIDEPPRSCRAKGLPARLELDNGETHVSYRIQPTRRGDHAFGAVHLRYDSPWRLWQRHALLALPEDVRIYPDVRVPLGGNDAATALRARQRRDVVIALDCGRSMGGEWEGQAQLDRGLNAALDACRVALSHGDRVSLLASSNGVEGVIGPVCGEGGWETILSASYDLEVSDQPSDYRLMGQRLVERCGSRSLVFLITHAFDDRHAETMLDGLRPLGRLHDLVCLFLDDPALVEMAARAPRNERERYESAAATRMLEAHARRLASLHTGGVHAAELSGKELGAQIVQHYLGAQTREELLERRDPEAVHA